jgi:hypothetical protein
MLAAPPSQRTVRLGRIITALPEGVPMPDLTIEPVRTASDLETFAVFPWTVYRDDPYWVPPLLSERRKLVDRERLGYPRSV